jgi:hypothetical protein
MYDSGRSKKNKFALTTPLFHYNQPYYSIERSALLPQNTSTNKNVYFCLLECSELFKIKIFVDLSF